MPIYLIGMMGAGKSTIGPELAARLERTFVDTDDEVERTTERTVAEIFEEEGEARFRELEREAIDRVSGDRAVIALGGGAIAQAGAVERLLERGQLVFLQADAPTLLARIGAGSSRPLLVGLDRRGQIERLESLLAERRASYEKASIRVDASRSITEVVDEIVAALQSD